MDISSFSVAGAKAATAVAPPAGAPVPTLPPSMVEQRVDPVADATPAPASSATEPAPADGAGKGSPAAQERAEALAAIPTAADIIEAARAAAEPAEPVPAETAEPERPGKVDPRFSALARKEAQLFREREEVKAQKAALETAHKQVVAFEEARAAAKRDPLAALEALGLSYDDLTEQVLNGNKPTANAEVAALRDELERFRAEQETAREKAEQAAQARLAAEQAAIIEEARKAAVTFVDANSARYELTALNNGASLVPQVREQHFARTGKLLTVEQAADLVEKHFEAVAEKVIKARKVQAKSTAPAPPATPPAERRTLSNALTASATVAPPKPRTDADRVRAALARLEGK